MSVGAVSGQAGVEGAIRRAAQAVGVDFDFLMRTARRESALNPQARARTSSAAGLFQFIEQTWLATLHRHGARHGYGRFAEMIQRTGDGYRVAGEARRAVMDLRFDPQAASLMAAELASDNAAYIRGRTGRDPTAGDLYAAHFLGPAGSARLIEAMSTRPGAPAASLFPDAARANRPIFYRGGRAATVAEVYANLSRTGGSGAAITTPTGPAEPAAPALEGRDLLLAEGMDRLRRDQTLLRVFLGEPGGAGAAFSTQLLAAFGPDRERT